MDNSKFVLIIDGNEVVADYRADEAFERLKIENTYVVRADSFSQKAKKSLFGGIVATRLYLHTKEDVQSMVKILEQYKKEDKPLDFVGDAFVLVLHPKVNRNSTKKLEKLSEELGARLVISKASDATSNVESLLSELYLSSSIKVFLKDHVGNSVDKLIPVMKIVEKLSQRQQENISLEDILIRISPKKGEIEPWGIEDAILKGNTTEAIKQLRRVSKTSSFLIPLAILKKNFTNMHTILALKQSNITDKNKIASITGMSPAQAGYVSKAKASKMTLENSTRILELIAEYENKVKGGESTDPEINTEILIARLCTFFK